VYADYDVDLKGSFEAGGGIPGARYLNRRSWS